MKIPVKLLLILHYYLTCNCFEFLEDSECILFCTGGAVSEMKKKKDTAKFV